MIIKYLKNYENLKGQIALLKSAIEHLTKLIEMDNLTDLKYLENRSSRKPLYNNPTQSEAINREHLTRVTSEEIKRDIQNQTILLAEKERLKRDIDIAMSTLNREQLYIIKCKYWHRMSWKHLLEHLQDKQEFKNKRAWSINTIISISDSAIDNMDMLLKQMYQNQEFLLLQF